jgi:hypothetical protein
MSVTVRYDDRVKIFKKGRPPTLREATPDFHTFPFEQQNDDPYLTPE